MVLWWGDCKWRGFGVGGYMGQTLVFVWNSAVRKCFSLYVSAVFCQCQRNFGIGGRTGRLVIIL